MANIFTKAYNALFTWEPTTSAIKSGALLGGDLMPAPMSVQQWTPNIFPNSRTDYSLLVGDPLTNSAIMAAVTWMLDMYPEAPFVVERQASKTDWEIDPTHPLTALINTPNPDYDGMVLWAGTYISLFLDGNAYWLKFDNALGPAELWYVPHFLMEPNLPDGGFSYTQNGRIYKLPRENVVHIRDGIDIKNTRKGMNRMKALLREVFTDNEATNYTATLLRNMGIPGIIISPTGAETEMADTDAQGIKEKFKERFGGDNRGDPMVMSVPIKIDVPGFNPQQMNADTLHDLSEERVAAVSRIPAIILGFGRGLDSATYSNFEQAQRFAVEQNMLPTQRRVAHQVGNRLLPLFESDPATTRARFDASGLAVLQENQTEKTTRAADMFAKGLWMRSEARVETGKDAGPEDDVYFVPSLGSLQHPDGTPLVEPPPPPQLAPPMPVPGLPNAGKTFRLNAPYVNAESRVLSDGN